ncbi:MAG: hypothetical protein LBO74_13070 [Candidatus Symbiothrix sp.]|jgi:hypothetical protein|nr:hypothetical protein [Candidatus Symbiothrix sp.]
MTQTAGIYIEHNAKGVPIFARIDLKKYGSELRVFFSTKGIEIERSPYNPEFVKMIKEAENSPIVASCGTKEELHVYLDSFETFPACHGDIIKHFIH